MAGTGTTGFLSALLEALLPGVLPGARGRHATVFQGDVRQKSKAEFARFHALFPTTICAPRFCFSFRRKNARFLHFANTLYCCAANVSLRGGGALRDHHNRAYVVC
eukprot:scaffold19869_cov121-Isochrysis_galbana.AAC.1